MVPKNVQDLGLIEAYEEAKIINWTKEEIAAYEYVAMRQKEERVMLTFVEKKGKQEGKQEGIKEGLIKGEEIGVEKTLQIFELIKQGKTDEEIIEKLKCSITRIQTIRKSFK